MQTACNKRKIVRSYNDGSCLITSMEVVLLDRRDACIITKQTRLSEKARFKTAAKKKPCKQHGELDMLMSNVSSSIYQMP